MPRCSSYSTAPAARARVGRARDGGVSSRFGDRRDRTHGSERTILGLAATRYRRRSRLPPVRMAALAGDRPCTSGVVSAWDCACAGRLARSSGQDTCLRSCPTIALASEMHSASSLRTSHLEPDRPCGRGAIRFPPCRKWCTCSSRWAKDAVKWVLRAIIPRSMLAMLEGFAIALRWSAAART